MASLIQLKQIESSSALIQAANIGADFSQSVLDSLTGATLKNITITTQTADQYSLIISGAVGIVDANGLSGTFSKDAFKEALEAIMLFLAKEMVRDGEGATKLVTYKVTGAVNDKEAEIAAKALSNSLLV